MDPSIRVQSAIKATYPAYWLRTLVMRSGLSGEAQGSFVPGVTPIQLEELLLKVEWHPYEHPDILKGCTAFTAAISGRMGLVHLRELPEDTPVTLEDPKGTGKVSAVVYGVLGEEVDFTVIILGPDEDSNRNPIPNTEVVWTFHPGPPVRPSLVSSEGLAGQTVSVQEAIQMGFDLAKVTNR